MAIEKKKTDLTSMQRNENFEHKVRRLEEVRSLGEHLFFS